MSRAQNRFRFAPAQQSPSSAETASVAALSRLFPAERSAWLPPNAVFGLVDKFTRDREPIRCDVQQLGFLGYEHDLWPHGESCFLERFPNLPAKPLDVDFDSPASEFYFLFFCRHSICAEMHIKRVCGKNALDLRGGQRLGLLPRKDVQENEPIT
jgi:hypothetical protein